MSWNSTTDVMLVVYMKGNPVQLVAQRVRMGAAVAPSAPAGLAGAAQSASSIAWSWGNVADESGYELRDDANVSRGTTWPDVLTITETGLSENSLTSRHVHAFSDSIYS